MATYTVIQDIEAEDNFLGPLTLKQFIFGAAGAFFGYLCFFAVTINAAFLLVIFVPPMLLGFFLAFPWSSQQPTEVWVLAKLQFRLKPKTRLWNQSGVEELVTITAPKVVEKHLTNGLNNDQIESRLKALAETIDSRGWATKNSTLLEGYSGVPMSSTDRLINPMGMPREVPEIDINQFHDVLDEDTYVSESFDQMIQTSEQTRRQQSLDNMDRIRNGGSIKPEQQAVQFTPPAAQQYSQFDEQMLSQQLKNRRAAGDIANGRLPSIPTSRPRQWTPPAQTKKVATEDKTQAQATMTKPVDPAILDLAQNNDLNIATIARQSHKKDLDDGEVVVSLR